MTKGGARIEFFSSYRSLHKISQKPELKSPSIAYLETIEKLNISPRPFGVLRESEKKIDLKYKGIGDKYAAALSESLRSTGALSSLDLKSSRLTSAGCVSILKSVNYDSLQHLTLSDNRIGSKTVDRIIHLLA